MVHVVRSDSGVYLTTTGLTREELVKLPRAARDADRWAGTVYAEKTFMKNPASSRDPVHSLQIGDLAFYGDPFAPLENS